MASFNSPSPSQMSEAMREKLARKYPGGRLITFTPFIILNAHFYIIMKLI